jgi:hypothetical protein
LPPARFGVTIERVLEPAAGRWLLLLTAALTANAVSCGRTSAPSPPSAPSPTPAERVVYANDFNGPLGTTYPEWSVARYSWTGNAAGTIAAGSGTEAIRTIESANGTQRFLGELGGPIILQAAPYDARHFVRVDESIDLSLTGLPGHGSLTLALDLYILKSWDGNNPIYGPDRWSVAIDGERLLATTFSNNFKTGIDVSLQDYPSTDSLPQTGAVAVNSLGYGFWFGDATYRLSWTLPHSASAATVTFSSSLNEGKSEQARSTRDESWGLDNVRVTIR